MQSHKFIFEPYKGIKTKKTCPSCNAKHKFKRYVNAENFEPLADHVGRCDREEQCGYHYKPKQYFEDNKSLKMDSKPYKSKSATTKEPEKPKAVSYIPIELMNQTLKAYDKNNFVKFLTRKYGSERVKNVLQLYHVGTSKQWPGATIFFQIDTLNKIRAGKIMLYNVENCKRVKEPFDHFNWIHVSAKMKDFNLSQCLFGSHLLKLYPTKPTALVESEKTAIIAAICWPQFNWLATGGVGNFKRTMCEPLKNKTVMVYPDAKAYQKWNDTAKELKDLATFFVSDLVEKNATVEELKKGFDLADYLLREPFQDFVKSDLTNKPSEILPKQIQLLKTAFNADFELSSIAEIQKLNIVECWPIDEMETFLLSINIPDKPIQLNTFTLINSPIQFIHSHLSVVKANNGHPTYKPYFDRLNELKKYIDSNF